MRRWPSGCSTRRLELNKHCIIYNNMNQALNVIEYMKKIIVHYTTVYIIHYPSYIQHYSKYNLSFTRKMKFFSMSTVNENHLVKL